MREISTKLVQGSFYQNILIYLSAVTLLFACSEIYIPLDPVPVTMQSVGVMVIGLLYNKKQGLISYGIYLALGAIGIPVFAEYTSGASILFGSTFGYFVGFGASIFAMNLIKLKLGTDSFWKIAINCALGTIITFIFGISWLSLIIGFNNAITFGLMPFIIPGLIKIFVLAGLLRGLKIIR
jgi:biotin transport system substrate-specific component